MKRAVSEITATFRDASIFIVDDNSELFQSAVYNYVKDEFLKRNINLVLKSHFINLDKDNKDELLSTFKFYCRSSNPADQRFFILTPENLFILLDDITRFKKKGNQITFAGELISG